MLCPRTDYLSRSVLARRLWADQRRGLDRSRFGASAWLVVDLCFGSRPLDVLSFRLDLVPTVSTSSPKRRLPSDSSIPNPRTIFKRVGDNTPGPLPTARWWDHFLYPAAVRDHSQAVRPMKSLAVPYLPDHERKA